MPGLPGRPSSRRQWILTKRWNLRRGARGANSRLMPAIAAISMRIVPRPDEYSRQLGGNTELDGRGFMRSAYIISRGRDVAGGAGKMRSCRGGGSVRRSSGGAGYRNGVHAGMRKRRYHQRLTGKMRNLRKKWRRRCLNDPVRITNLRMKTSQTRRNASRKAKAKRDARPQREPHAGPRFFKLK